jgi:hypothetical protein
MVIERMITSHGPHYWLSSRLYSRFGNGLDYFGEDVYTILPRLRCDATAES